MEFQYLDRKHFNFARKTNLFFIGATIALFIALGIVFVGVVFYVPILTITTLKVSCLFVFISGIFTAIWEANIVGLLLYLAGIIAQLLGLLLKTPG